MKIATVHIMYIMILILISKLGFQDSGTIDIICRFFNRYIIDNICSVDCVSTSMDLNDVRVNNSELLARSCWGSMSNVAPVAYTYSFTFSCHL